MTQTVTGTAIYRERIALPPGAVVEVVLEDVSRADAPAEQIGSERFEPTGGPPFPFSIDYDPARIVASHRYAVRARVLVDEQLRFATDTHHPVLTHGAGDTVEVMLRMVAPADPGPTATLEETYWKLTDLGGVPVAAPPEGRREAHLLLNREGSRVSGSGGCNRLTGTYEIAGDRLTFGPTAMTMMMCVDGMETEAAFVAALSRVTGWTITGETLTLSGVDGEVARFASVYLR